MTTRVMNELDMISLRNLMLLAKNHDNEKFRWYVKGPEIKPIDPETESYDTGTSCNELEYPCLLMFHQLFRFLEDSNRLRFREHTQRDILSLMEHSLESVFQILDTADESTEDKERLACLLNECDDRHSFHYEFYHRESVCSKIGIWVAERFDMFVEGLRESRRYLYLTPLTMDLNDSDNSDDSDNPDDSDDDEGYQDPKKEC
jgi:hypothetical protein